jgi:hypothetical protein
MICEGGNEEEHKNFVNTSLNELVKTIKNTHITAL